jgi:hypothetical protein
MDPYLEGYLWPDVHNAIAGKIRQQRAPQLQPRYVARLEVYVVEDTFPESNIGIVYPDVEVMQVKTQPQPGLAPAPGSTAVTPAPLTLPVIQSVPVKITTVDIRDTAQNQLVTCIEILSPVNKRKPGLDQYRQKRQRLYQAGIDFLELDLLRRGQRPFDQPQLPAVAYAIALTRAHSNTMDIWPLTLQDRLPTLPVPLCHPDPDAILELAEVLNEIYDEAFYGLSIDYRQAPPPPPLSDEEEAWVRSQLFSPG